MENGSEFTLSVSPQPDLEGRIGGQLLTQLQGRPATLCPHTPSKISSSFGIWGRYPSEPMHADPARWQVDKEARPLALQNVHQSGDPAVLSPTGVGQTDRRQVTPL